MSQATPDIIAGSTAPGGSTMQASEDAHKAAATSNSGTSKPSYSEAGTPWFDTANDIMTYENNAGASVTVAASSVFTESANGLVPAPVTEAGKFLKDDGTWATPAGSVATLPANDATPSVLGGGVFEEAYTTPTIVTALDDGVKGDKVTIMFTTSNMTVAAALTKTGMIIPCIAGDVMEWTHNGTTFKQTGGTVGMGNFVKITKNSIGDWPAGSTTAYAAVDVSDDGVRKGANAALIVVQMDNSSTTDLMLWIADNTGGTNADVVLRTRQTQGIMAPITAQLDNDGKFAAKHQAAITTSSATVTGYYI
jgi:hypothetical protein